jgi:hypothetical protein
MNHLKAETFGSYNTQFNTSFAVATDNHEKANTCEFLDKYLGYSYCTNISTIRCSCMSSTNHGFVGMLAATLSSVIESIGDYFAAARISNGNPPPAHALNRGIAAEGFSSIISGMVGAGHATTY